MEVTEDNSLNKNAIEAEMRKCPNSFSRDQIIELLGKGIFTEYELVQKGLMSKEAIDFLRHDDYQYQLPDIEYIPYDNNYPQEGGTDIFFIGIPSVGKTCLIMSLLNSDRVSFDSRFTGGLYANYLIQYCHHGVMPCRTIEGADYIINATVRDNKGRHHKVNFIDISWYLIFTYQKKKYLGTHITYEEEKQYELFQNLIHNKNPKVFYFLIDPTIDSVSSQKTVPIFSTSIGKDGNENSKIVDYTSEKTTIFQEEALTLFVNDLFPSTNRQTSQLLTNKHIIVTKSDTLGDNEDMRKSYFYNGNNYNLIRRLIWSMREIKNKPKGSPSKLYFHSIGRVFPGGFVDYGTNDTDKILSSICNATPYETTSFFLRLLGCKKYFNKHDMEEDGGIILNNND